MKKLLPLIIILLLLSSCAPAQNEALAQRNVFYAGEEGGVKTALSMAGYSLVSDPSHAQAFVLNGEIPDAAGIAERVKAGAGLVLILGENITQEDVQELLGVPVTLTGEKEALSLIDAERISDPLLEEIIWNGAPQVRERSIIDGLDLVTESLVAGYETGEGVLWKGSASAGEERAFVLTPWLSGQANPQIQEWGYFNYLIYHLVERAAGAEPMAFADYPASPVPHSADRNTLFIFWRSFC